MKLYLVFTIGKNYVYWFLQFLLIYVLGKKK